MTVKPERMKPVKAWANVMDGCVITFADGVPILYDSKEGAIRDCVDMEWRIARVLITEVRGKR